MVSTLLQTFIEALNEHHHTVNFTAQWSPKEITFLDTKVSLHNGVIQTNLHVKPTDTHQYLLATSCHPRHNKTSIAYSQALRIRRICSMEVDFNKRAEDLLLHLKDRGYQR